MTTLVAVHTPGKGVVFGSDTQYTRGNSKTHSPHGKWVISPDGRWAVGCSGTLRTMNIIKAESEIIFDKLHDPFDFAQRLQSVLDEYKFSLKAKMDDEELSRHPSFDCGLLLVSAHGIWEIGYDFAILQHESVAAAGSGSDFALGALHATKTKRPKDRVTAGLLAAVTLDTYSGGSMVIGEIKP